MFVLNNMQEALTNPRWKATINKEMKSLKKIECENSLKYKVDGIIECLKTRPVSNLYINYTKTFTVIAKINII